MHHTTESGAARGMCGVEVVTDCADAAIGAERLLPHVMHDAGPIATRSVARAVLPLRPGCDLVSKPLTDMQACRADTTRLGGIARGKIVGVLRSSCG
jgi:hypothetical protein